MTRDADFAERHAERIPIRRFRPKDAAAFAAYRSDPDVARYQSWDGYSLMQAERFIDEMAHADPGEPGEWFQFAVPTSPRRPDGRRRPGVRPKTPRGPS